MNTSKFMDKQIMDLSRSNEDFLDLMNPNPANDNTDQPAESAGVAKEESILPNYDFQPIRPGGVAYRSSDSPSMGGGSGGGADGAHKSWNSADSKPNSSPTRSYGYLGSIEPDKVVLEKAHSVSDATIVSEIDRTMKRHTDNLLHAIDGLSARLSQLESRTRQLEHSVDDLKESIGNSHGSTDGKMRQLENILRELQSGVLDLKDKQDVMNARIQLEKLQTPEVDQTPENHNAAHIIPPQQTPQPAPQQPTQQFPIAPPQSHPGVSPNAPPPPPHQSVNPPMQLPNQYSPTPMPSVPQHNYLPYLPPPNKTQQESPGQTQEAPTQQYSLPPPQQQQQPQNLPPQQYQPTPPTPYPQGHHLPQQYQQQPIAAAVNPPPPQLQLPMAHHSDEALIPSQNYPPPQSGPLPSQQFYGAPPSHMYDSPTGRSGSGFSSSVYNPSTTPSEQPYPYGGSSSHYGNNPGTKHPPHSSGSGGNYPQIPTARVLPQAIPTAAAVSGGAGSGGSGNRVPIDDVIDKVTNMGFSREQVRGTVRKLTENGQPVDLNVVLDKLMNDRH